MTAAAFDSHDGRQREFLSPRHVEVSRLEPDLHPDLIAVSLSIEPEDLDLNPFDRRGGLGRFYEIFGDDYEAILQEMNLELVA